LQVDPSKRMSIAEALEHAWLGDPRIAPLQAPEELLPESIRRRRREETAQNAAFAAGGHAGGRPSLGGSGGSNDHRNNVITTNAGLPAGGESVSALGSTGGLCGGASASALEPMVPMPTTPGCTAPQLPTRGPVTPQPLQSADVPTWPVAAQLPTAPGFLQGVGPPSPTATGRQQPFGIFPGGMLTGITDRARSPRTSQIGPPLAAAGNPVLRPHAVAAPLEVPRGRRNARNLAAAGQPYVATAHSPPPQSFGQGVADGGFFSSTSTMGTSAEVNLGSHFPHPGFMSPLRGAPHAKGFAVSPPPAAQGQGRGTGRDHQLSRPVSRPKFSAANVSARSGGMGGGSAAYEMPPEGDDRKSGRTWAFQGDADSGQVGGGCGGCVDRNALMATASTTTPSRPSLAATTTNVSSYGAGPPPLASGGSACASGAAGSPETVGRVQRGSAAAPPGPCGAGDGSVPRAIAPSTSVRQINSQTGTAGGLQFPGFTREGRPHMQNHHSPMRGQGAVYVPRSPSPSMSNHNQHYPHSPVARAFSPGHQVPYNSSSFNWAQAPVILSPRTSLSPMGRSAPMVPRALSPLRGGNCLAAAQAVAAGGLAAGPLMGLPRARSPVPGGFAWSPEPLSPARSPRRSHSPMGGQASYSQRVPTNVSGGSPRSRPGPQRNVVPL
jgi:hypothetical protein